MKKGTFTYNEIKSQPDAWQQALTLIERNQSELLQYYAKGAFDQVVFTGCGSTYYLSLAAAANLQQELGVSARALPASEIWLNPASLVADRKTLLIATSRSGETSETIRACQRFRADISKNIITLSCYPGKPLTKLGALNLVFPSAQEQSVAQTRAFSTLFLAAVLLPAVWGNSTKTLQAAGKLPDVCSRLMDAAEVTVRKLGGNRSFERFYFLGSGVRYGLACELNLKMKEMSLSHSEAFYFLEFRHGPQSMANGQTLMVGLVSNRLQKAEQKVLQEMNKRSATILFLGEKGCTLNFMSGMAQSLQNLLYLPVGQLLAYYRAISRGLDPDRPKNLTAVVKL
jgi:glucosamine--fructose-6-phosphate aminotransferase (isomerizing)